MYLNRIQIENVGPIVAFSCELPFDGDQPLPLVLVGPNGSGKSTVLSFIVNALIGFKQQAFENAEVQENKVYRLRSTQFIRNGAHWYFAKLQFEGNLELEEWTLDRPKTEFELHVSPLPLDDGWKKIPQDGYEYFALVPQPGILIRRELSKPLQKLFRQNAVLFFPSDRFEPPDWLNEQSLAQDLHFPEPKAFDGQTRRKILSRTLLRPTLDWIKAVLLDSFLQERTTCESLQFTQDIGSIPIPVARPVSRDGKIIHFVAKVLARILGSDDDSVHFKISHRNSGAISVEFTRCGKREQIPTLLGLSAGQAALFCAFTNIIRDFDLDGAQFDDISDIRGLVLFDEADLHLHVDLQYRVLPELLKLFPKVQFILSAHSPLLIMGIRNIFGDDGFHVREMPDGQRIGSEEFSEFNSALAAFTRTNAYDRQVFELMQKASKPIVITEGKTDATHIETAWRKLYNGNPMPFDVISCGGVGTPKEDRGGADMLRTMLRACCLHIERPTLGLFDHDREGMEQFNGLTVDGFIDGECGTHRRHTAKPVQALLLPVPEERKEFVAQKPRSCYLAIEHYYTDELLKQYHLADDPVVVDSSVFTIVNESKKKVAFARAASSLPTKEFRNFESLFAQVIKLLGLRIESSMPSLDPRIAVEEYLAPNPSTFERGVGIVQMVTPYMGWLDNALQNVSPELAYPEISGVPPNDEPGPAGGDREE